eukprot:14655627-Alexandrium_andersonii.AAC.1
MSCGGRPFDGVCPASVALAPWRRCRATIACASSVVDVGSSEPIFVLRMHSAVPRARRWRPSGLAVVARASRARG